MAQSRAVFMAVERFSSQGTIFDKEQVSLVSLECQRILPKSYYKGTKCDTHTHTHTCWAVFSPASRHGPESFPGGSKRSMGYLPSSARQLLGRCIPRPPVKVSPALRQDLRLPDEPVQFACWCLYWPLRTRFPLLAKFGPP